MLKRFQSFPILLTACWYYLIVLSIVYTYSASYGHSFLTHSTGKRLQTTTLNSYRKDLSNIVAVTGAWLALFSPNLAHARPEGVNRPDLLPKAATPLIDTANFLTKGQEKRIIDRIEDLEKKTQLKLRVLCQNFPETPGLAIKDFWGVDDKTVVMVIDQGEGFNGRGIPSNAIHLNIGAAVEEAFPTPQFWQRMTNKLGNNFYVKDKGIDISTINAVEAITYCLETMDDPKCNDVPFDL